MEILALRHDEDGQEEMIYSTANIDAIELYQHGFRIELDHTGETLLIFCTDPVTISQDHDYAVRVHKAETGGQL